MAGVLDWNKSMNDKENVKTMSVFAFLYRYGRRARGWFAVAALATFVSVAASFLMPQVIRFAVDSVLSNSDTDVPPFIQALFTRLGGQFSQQELLLFCAGAVVVLSVVSGLFNFASRTGMAKGTELFCRDLRNKVYRHVQYLPFKWHVNNQTGEIIQRCTADVEVVRTFVSTLLLELLRTLLLVVTASVLMFSMNVPLTLVALCFVPLIAGYSTVFFRLVGQRFLKADEAEGVLTSAVQENLTGVRVVRAFGREKYELERFDKYNEIYANHWFRLGHTLSVYWGFGDFATGLQIMSIVLAGAWMAVHGQLSLGEFLVFVAYNQMLAWPIRAMGRTLSEMSKTGVSAKRIQEILDETEEAPEPGALRPNLAADIRFENVTFRYGNEPVLQDLNFTVPQGGTFGIMGATGSGKSTITYLLNRLYELPEGCGHIYFGDVPVEKIDRYYLRRNVGLVLQEPFLFSRTIEENIGIAVERPELARVRATAATADVDAAISEFSGGYGTVVGERGVTLSGGQKQRVAIARTLMLDAPVMVFDDSMSAVDLETDARIREALRRDKGDATVILISHRINTLMQADSILVLEDGRIADIGTHAELIRRPGLYKRIYDLQSEAGASCPLPGEGGGDE